MKTINSRSLIVLILINVFIQVTITAQVAINNDGSPPDSSAMLDIQGTSGGLLIPRLTSYTRSLLTNAAKGLLVYQTNPPRGFYYNQGDADDIDWVHISTTFIPEIADEDGDTKVITEFYPDEDVVRFQLADTVRWKMVGTRLEPTNDARSVFIGENAGQYTTETYNRSVFVGNNAGGSNTDGAGNVFVGGSAGFKNTTGDWNVFLGRDAGVFNTTGSENILIGNDANRYNTTGSNNVIIGNDAGRGYSEHHKSGNVFIGNRAGYGSTDSNKLIIDNSGTTSPLLYGDFDTDELTINSSLKMTDGVAITEFSNDGTLGDSSAVSIPTEQAVRTYVDTEISEYIPDRIEDTDGDTKILVEELPDEDIIHFRVAGSGRWQMKGKTLMPVNNAGNVFIGFDAGVNCSLGTDYDNVFVGDEAGKQNTGGKKNTYLGTEAGVENGSGNYNTFVGYMAGRENLTDKNTIVGYQAGRYSTSGEENTFIGFRAGYDLTSGSRNTYIGMEAGQNDTSGVDNCFVGHAAGWWNVTGHSNVFVGTNSGHRNVSGNYNVAIGMGADSGNYAGDRNVMIGHRAGSAVAQHIKYGNVRIGYQAGMNDNSDDKLYIDNSSTTDPLIYGDFSSDNLKVNGNIEITDSLNVGNYITVAGAYSLPIGAGKTGQLLKTNGSGAIASWTYVTQESTIAGSGLSMSGTTVRLGGTLSTGATITQGSYATEFNLSGTGDFRIKDAGSDILVVTDNGRVGINVSAPSEQFHIIQDEGDIAVRMTAPGLYHYWNVGVGDAGLGNYKWAYRGVAKANIRSTDGLYQQASDRRLKEQIEPLGSVLDKFLQLKPSKYYYKSDEIKEVKSIGFIAQEVEEFFPELVGSFQNTEDGITYQNLGYDNFAVLSVQAIIELNEELEHQVSNQKKELDELKSLVEQLSSRLSEIEAK